MQALIDFFPLILFFTAYKLYGMFTAIAVLIVATFVQVAYLWFRYREVKQMHIITLVLVTLFGGLSIYFQDVTFIKWKVSVINWLFAVIVIGSQFIGKKTIMQRLMGSQISMPEPIWRKVNLSWGVFFTVVGFLNVYVAFYYQLDQTEEVREATWVNFKVFWLMGLTLAFSLIQMLFISKYIDAEDSATPEQSEYTARGEK